MPQSAIFRLVPVNRLRLSLAAIVMLACGVWIGVLAFDLMGKIDRTSDARSDNMQWTLNQVDVELLQLILAVDEARLTPGKLDEVRLRFDVFYSRSTTLQQSGAFLVLRRNAGFEQSIVRIRQFVTRYALLIDGSDEKLRQGLEVMSTAAQALSREAHQIALTGLEIFARETDVERQDLQTLLIKVGLLTLLLVAMLAASVMMLLSLYRGNRRRAVENLGTLSRLNAIVTSALDAVITVDASGRIVDFNASASATFGHARGEAMGSMMADLIALGPEGEVPFQPGTTPRISGQGRVRITARHKNGQIFPAEIAVTEASSDHGPLYVVFLRDLSAQVAAEQALVKARDDALAGEKAKADLLVVMSHEIRTPLNGMIGTIELLDTTDLQAHQREYLRIMEASGKLLMHHVNEVLDIARLDSGKAPLSLGPVDLVALMGEVLDNQAPAALANGNRLTLIPPPDGRNLVIADPAQLRQVLLNLVGNAVKFTHDGSISVAIAHQGPRGPTEITIADTGIGIAPADLDRIFDDFVTLDTTYARRASGTGLGLGIARRIVALMGGTLAVESQRSQGSTFRIRLPLPILAGAAIPTPATVPAPQPGSAALLTLVVEDNDFNRLIVRDMLSRDGHDVVEARDGAEGIRLAAERQFDLILMDISMPNTDGLQATRAIRAGNGASRSTPIVALTAHALSQETDQFRAGGMQQILVKPITRDALRATIAAVQNGTVPGQALGGPTPAGALLLDLTVLHALIEDLGHDRAHDLMAKFLAEVGTSIDQLVAGTDLPMLREIHRLEGSAGMFGAQALHARLAQIETLCKAGDMAAARIILADLALLWRDTELAYRSAVPLPQPSSLR